jgi:ribosome-binding factor A
MKSHRLARVAEAIREVAANTILFEIKDPRVKNVTVTRAEVTADLLYAKVYVSILGSEKQQRLAMHGLEHAAGFVQKKLGERMTTRVTPHVTFVLDEGVKKSLAVSRILAEEKAKRGEVAEAEAVSEDESDKAED